MFMQINTTTDHSFGPPRRIPSELSTTSGHIIRELCSDIQLFLRKVFWHFGPMVSQDPTDHQLNLMKNHNRQHDHS